MKHLKSYNESYKEPLDVESDVEKFKKMFKSVIPKYNWETGSDKKYSLEDNLNQIISDNPTMNDDWDIWGVYRRETIGDMHSRKLPYMLYVKAFSEDHAKLKWSIDRKDIDYFFKYEAEKLSKEDIEGIIDSLEYEIYLIKNPI
jgi:hypothetical protein